MRSSFSIFFIGFLLVLYDLRVPSPGSVKSVVSRPFLITCQNAVSLSDRMKA